VSSHSDALTISWRHSLWGRFNSVVYTATRETAHWTELKLDGKWRTVGYDGRREYKMCNYLWQVVNMTDLFIHTSWHIRHWLPSALSRSNSESINRHRTYLGVSTSTLYDEYFVLSKC